MLSYCRTVRTSGKRQERDRNLGLNALLLCDSMIITVVFLIPWFNDRPLVVGHEIAASFFDDAMPFGGESGA